MFNRRTFLKSSATLSLATGLGPFAHAQESAAKPGVPASAGTLMPLPARLAPLDAASQPWQQRVRRVGQTNMTEHDPAGMDVEQWADFWKAAGVDIIYVSVTGILAFYPSKVPFHKHGKYLNGRDFFGECARAAKKRGLRVVARMSPDLNWPDALAAHPEWAMRNKDGSPKLSVQEPQLFSTCMFSSYMDDYVPAIMREINSLYDVDCFYANGWPPIGSLPECHCAICSKLPAAGTPAYWRVFNDRLIELWEKYNAIAREKKEDSFFFANLGGNVRASADLVRMAKTASWFQADNQGRTYQDAEVWGCTRQARVCTAVMGGKIAANVTGAYATSNPGWRNGSKGAEETRMWLNESVAGGVAPYVHFVGGREGFGVDRRWQKTTDEFFAWMARHDAHFRNRRPVANVGVVMGQSTQLLYPGPETEKNRSYMRETTNGVYGMLLEGRYAFNYVHEEQLEPERLSGYTALLLPNVAMLSERQCGQIRNYVQAGGSVMASFETGLYDEELRRRGEFGLADVLGVAKAGDAVGTNGNAYYARIERSHPIVEGFSETQWLAGAENRVPLKPVEDAVLTVVPGFVRYPPELAYPPVERTQEPAVVLREVGQSRVAYFPGDIERTWWVTGNGDLLRLMHNTLRWVTRGQRAVDVQGEGLVEIFAWETEPGYAVHLLNYTNPNAHQGWLHTTYALGPQRVAMEMPAGVTVRAVEILRAGGSVPFRMDGRQLRFTIPRVEDYEVAAITIA